MNLIEPEVTENQLFDKRVEPFSEQISGKIRPSSFDARTFIETFSIETSLGGKGLPIEILLEQCKP